MNVAPWEVEICPLRLDDELVVKTANKLYDDLKQAGIDVLIDDRDVSAGFKFADSELIGVPIRVVVSPRNLAEGKLEIAFRESGIKDMINLNDAVTYLTNAVQSAKF